MEQDEILAKMRNIVANNQHYSTWTVSTPHLVMLVNSSIEAEREVNRELVAALKKTQHALSRAGATLRHPAKYVKDALKAADAALNKAQGEKA